MYINIDISTLLKDNDAFMKQFNRDSYADAFEEFCNKYSELYVSIGEEYNNAENKSEYIKELSMNLVSFAENEYKEMKKNKRTNY